MAFGPHPYPILKVKTPKKLLMEVKDIDGIEILDSRWLDETFVYFLLKEGSPVYIGKSKNLMTRVKDHVRDPRKEFDQIAVKMVPEDIPPDIVESFYIQHFDPPYNNNKGEEPYAHLYETEAEAIKHLKVIWEKTTKKGGQLNRPFEWKRFAERLDRVPDPDCPCVVCVDQLQKLEEETVKQREKDEKEAKLYGEIWDEFDQEEYDKEFKRTGILCIYDNSSGEGHLEVSEELKYESAIFRLDVLGDWLHDIKELYEEAYKDYEVWAKKIRKEAQKKGHHVGHEPQEGVYDH